MRRCRPAASRATARSAAALVALLGFASLAYGIFASGLGTAKVLIFMLVGALLIFIGVAMFSSWLVGPLAAGAEPGRALGGLPLLDSRLAVLVAAVLAPARAAPSAPAPPDGGSASSSLGAVLNPLLLLVVLAMRISAGLTRWRPEWPAEFPGVLPDASAARIGSENSQRNPQRTASTAAALMIGLALVTLVATLAAGIIAPFRGAVNNLFTADYAITAQNNFSPIPPSVAAAAARAPGVEEVTSIRGGDGHAFGKTIQVTATEPNLGKVITSTKWKEGSAAVLSRLGSDGAFVTPGFAKSHNLHLGSPLELLTPTGKRLPLRVKAVYQPPTGGSPFGQVTISTRAFDSAYQQPQNLFSFVTMRGGSDDANTAALDGALKSFPNAKVQTRKQFIDNQISGLQSVLNVLYVLLALSVVVSVFGIVNTLVLTVFERTRELGMLRAIGMTRRQVRRMIRHESVITALLGAALGIVLGLVLGALLTARVKDISFVVPWTSDRDLRDRLDPRRDRRRDPAGAARVAAERARSASVRVTRRTGSRTPGGEAPRFSPGLRRGTLVSTGS